VAGWSSFLFLDGVDVRSRVLVVKVVIKLTSFSLVAYDTALYFARLMLLS